MKSFETRSQEVDRWLRCRVTDGMFSNERTVVIRRRGNGTVAFFVPAQSTEGGSRVRVRVFHRIDGAWAELPTPYHDSIPIEEKELDPVER